MRLNRLIAISAATIVLTAAALAQTLPPGVQKVTSIEGVTEYAFPNGLHVLLFPDNSKPKITVNVVYMVGSRNEGYGETGMAHLLEHMVFKGTKSGQEVFKELTDRTGGNFNGTTSYDQTMYYETLNSSDENLRWALGLEAARMVNMTMLKKDLDTEMTAVRNEMESGENSPLNVLHQRVLAAAYNFHNYGKTVIGNRTDVERVPIANLTVFYQKYYQPDNAVLIVAGQFDESKTLALVAETLGAIPKPQRVLTQPYTAEPTQEGERSVMLRRVGNIQVIMAVYHIPAALHPDLAALEVMAQVLGAPQTGRLYKALGEFLPTTAPDRAEIPATPEAAVRFKDYKGGATIQQGEAFDLTPQNIEARVIRAKLPNGLKLVMFPKKTRGGTVTATINVRFGDEKSLFDKST